MRKQIVAGNWKMNNDINETKTLLNELSLQSQSANATIIVAPAYINLKYAVDTLQNGSILVASQNMHFASHGAYTGEISASMLKSIGVNIVILGHSERRAYFNETSDLLVQKVDAALANNMDVIFCFGEELKDRKEGKHFEIVKNQIKDALFHLQANVWKNIILAYEPVWAIGTGETASPEQAQEMHHFIRSTIEAKYSSAVSEDVSILYGGSVKPNNAKEIFSKPDVDGGLIGGAALNATDFTAICNAFKS